MYLVHHGVSNQKWGVKNGPPYPLSRKYMTEDGTLTKKGLKRQAREHVSKVTRSTVNKWVKKDIADSKKELKRQRDIAKSSHKAMSKNRSTLSDDELKAQINRLQLEVRLRELTETNLHPGRATVKKILENSSQSAITEATKSAIRLGANEITKAVKQ